MILCFIIDFSVIHFFVCVCVFLPSPSRGGNAFGNLLWKDNWPGRRDRCVSGVWMAEFVDVGWEVVPGYFCSKNVPCSLIRVVI